MPLPHCPKCKWDAVEWLSTFGEPPRHDYYRCLKCRHVWNVTRATQDRRVQRRPHSPERRAGARS
jgi:hypothetical protein